MFLGIDKIEGSRIAAIDDKGQQITYAQLAACPDHLNGVISPRSVVFLLCRNTVGGLVAYISMVENGIVPVTLNGSIDQELFDVLYDTYHPQYICVETEQAEKYGFEKLHFYQGDIASYEGVDHVDMVVTLHACDTATDFALAKAVTWGAEVILSVPCCQHELNRQISNDVLKPIMEYGILKERMAALLTDGLRAEMLKDMGYKVDILEFIDMEHTPKNLLIRAIKKNSADVKEIPSDAIASCMEFFGAKPTLEALLYHQKEKRT